MEFAIRNSISEGHNVLVLGQAGCGKSFLLSKVYSELKSKGKNVHAVGTTGISSCHLPRGQTLHKFFGLLDGRFSNAQLLSRINSDDNYFETKQRILNSDVVLLDECSMLSRKTLEQIDFLCRNVRENPKPFGDIQMCLFGDLFQLPQCQTICMTMRESLIFLRHSNSMCTYYKMCTDKVKVCLFYYIPCIQNFVTRP